MAVSLPHRAVWRLSRHDHGWVAKLRRPARQWPIVEQRSAPTTSVQTPAEDTLESVAKVVSVDALDVLGGAFRTDVLHCGTSFFTGETAPHPVTNARNFADIAATVEALDVLPGQVYDARDRTNQITSSSRSHTRQAPRRKRNSGSTTNRCAASRTCRTDASRIVAMQVKQNALGWLSRSIVSRRSRALPPSDSKAAMDS
jgi:hypothetical protein